MAAVKLIMNIVLDIFRVPILSTVSLLGQVCQTANWGPTSTFATRDLVAKVDVGPRLAVRHFQPPSPSLLSLLSAALSPWKFWFGLSLSEMSPPTTKICHSLILVVRERIIVDSILFQFEFLYLNFLG